jgi:hypothetical protein
MIDQILFVLAATFAINAVVYALRAARVRKLKTEFRQPAAQKFAEDIQSEFTGEAFRAGVAAVTLGVILIGGVLP